MTRIWEFVALWLGALMLGIGLSWEICRERMRAQRMPSSRYVPVAGDLLIASLPQEIPVGWAKFTGSTMARLATGSAGRRMPIRGRVRLAPRRRAQSPAVRTMRRRRCSV